MELTVIPSELQASLRDKVDYILCAGFFAKDLGFTEGFTVRQTVGRKIKLMFTSYVCIFYSTGSLGP